MTHKGKKAIVTGAAQGIGFAIAQRLAQEGAKVAICDINLEKAKEQAVLLNSRGCDCEAFYVDAGDVSSIQKMTNEVAESFSGIDILVNNAGILDSFSIENMTEENWDKVMRINLKSVFFASQAALKYLKKSSAGRILNISSLAGRMGGYETGMAYTASKGGILSITMGMARQLAPFGITVNSLCPGTTESELIKAWSPEQIARLTARIPMGRLGQPQDMGAAAAFLTGDEAGFITGLFLDVNGGMYMG